jgi:hypothetical protein
VSFDAKPEWTQPTDKRGLDPLGLQTSGISIYQELLPGISNVTLRMRPYGLYVWLTEAYARQSGGSTDLEAWRRWVRRAEALYALTAADAGGEVGVAGVDWAGRRLAGLAAGNLIDFGGATESTGSDLYLRQSMGIYGGAYRSQMVEMGLLDQAEDERNQIPVPTPALGLPLASAFGESLGQYGKAIILAAINNPVVRRADLVDLRGILPSQIDPESSEAAIYLRALFGTHEGADSRDAARRRTLQLILAVAMQEGALPNPDQIRWALFNAAPGMYGDNLEPERLRWEAYQTHDLLQLAYAVLLRLSIELLKTGGADLTFRELVAVSASRACEAVPGARQQTWSEFVSTSGGQSLSALATPLTRIPAEGIPLATVAAALTTIGALQARVDARPELAAEIDAKFPRAHPSVFNRSIRSELAFLHARNEHALADVVSEIFADRIIRRHSEVAMLKFARQRDYTFLFETNDGRLKYRANYGPVLTTPRLGPAITFLADLRLLDATGPTASGKIRLAEIA